MDSKVAGAIWDQVRTQFMSYIPSMPELPSGPTLYLDIPDRWTPSGFGPRSVPGIQSPLQSDSTYSADPSRNEIVRIAHEELERDIIEDLGNDRDSGGHIAKYFGIIPGLGEGNPYCAAFVSWILDQAGLHELPDIAWVPNYHSMPAFAPFCQFVQPVHLATKMPQPGDIVTFDNGAHVELVTGYDESTGTMETIGGNTVREDGRWGVAKKKYSESELLARKARFVDTMAAHTTIAPGRAPRIAPGRAS